MHKIHSAAAKQTSAFREEAALTIETQKLVLPILLHGFITDDLGRKKPLYLAVLVPQVLQDFSTGMSTVTISILPVP